MLFFSLNKPINYITQTNNKNYFSAAILPDPGEVQIMTENIAGQIALIGTLLFSLTYNFI